MNFGKFVLITFFVLLTCQVQAQTTINFDDITAPVIFANALPLTTQYTPQGVTFSGGGAILNQNSNFHINAVSQSNFLAFNVSSADLDGTVPNGPETFSFTNPETSVSLYAYIDSRTGGTVTLNAFDGAALVSTNSLLNDGSSYTLLTASASHITSAVYSFTGSSSVVDNLTFNYVAPSASSTPEPGSLALLIGLGASGAGFLVRRRRSACKV